MLVPNRNYLSPSYRYGFQGQEKDDEIKGNGNSLNYKFRMHDPRVGRFLSIDPLYKSYPWNSSYAFSENRVIDSREFEGLERYFSVFGSSLGQVGYSNEIRVLTSEYLYETLEGSFSYDVSHIKVGSKRWSNLLLSSKVLSENDDSVIAGVGKTIFYKEINSDALLGDIEVATSYNGDKGMTMSTDGKRNWTIYKDMTQDGERLIDDYYSFVNMTVHEEEHGNGNVYGTIWDHVYAEVKAINHHSFNLQKESGRNFSIDVLRGYVNKQMSSLMRILESEYGEDNLKSDGLDLRYRIYKYTIDEHNKISDDKIKTLTKKDIFNKAQKK